MQFLFRRKTKAVQDYHSESSNLDFIGVPERFQYIYHDVAAFTMASAERIFSLCEAVEYVCRSDIRGDIVECGVWKGGSMMAAALTLLNRRATDRTLWMFDTFEGMSEPTIKDVDFCGQKADELMRTQDPSNERSVWCCADEAVTRSNLAVTNYPLEQMVFVPGDVGETLMDPVNLPEKIAVLRLDTDWYESTKIELEQLFPRLEPGGVLIVDDYGHWQGCRAAVDEYIRENDISILLNRIDYTGRIGIKPHGCGVDRTVNVR